MVYKLVGSVGGAVSYPDDEHGALDFVGGGPHKLGGDSIHGVVQHADGGHQLEVCMYTHIRHIPFSKSGVHTHTVNARSHCTVGTDIIITASVWLDGPQVLLVPLPLPVLERQGGHLSLE